MRLVLVFLHASEEGRVVHGGRHLRQPATGTEHVLATLKNRRVDVPVGLHDGRQRREQTELLPGRDVGTVQLRQTDLDVCSAGRVAGAQRVAGAELADLGGADLGGVDLRALLSHGRRNDGALSGHQARHQSGPGLGRVDDAPVDPWDHRLSLDPPMSLGV